MTTKKPSRMDPPKNLKGMLQPGDPGSPERTELREGISKLVGGHALADVISALADVLASCAILASTDRRNMRRFCRALSSDLEDACERNWDDVKASVQTTKAQS